MVGVAVGVAGVAGAASTAIGAHEAAGAQTDAANAAIAQQNKMFNTIRKDFAPYRALGQTGINDLTRTLDFLTSPIKMDQSTLEQTPGYQFTLGQGLRAVQNSAAARGLGSSGAALKGAADFATGLADKTYLDQFNLENINRTNAFNRLTGVVNIGQNATAQTGSAGQNAANQNTSSLIGAGNAQAAGYNAMGASVGQGLGSVASGLQWNSMYGAPAATPAPVYYGTGNLYT